jgi:DNA-binding response OmpR family regulator/DNA-binding Xre family transcriptional regulator
MKPSILVATQDAHLKTSIKSEMAGLCVVSSVGASGSLFTALGRERCDVLVLDVKLPGLDGLNLLRALRHRTEPMALVISVGSLDPTTVLGMQETGRFLTVPSLSPRPVLTALRAVLDPVSSRSIQGVRYQPDEKRFFVTFRNARSYELARNLIEADDGTAIFGEPEIIHDGEAFKVRQRSGNEYEVPWDFVLYHQEPSYEYHKGKASQIEAEANRAARIGARVRQARNALRWSLDDLAKRTGMHPPNLSRLESGKHVPSLETLERVAGALGVRVADLVAA